MNEFRHTPGEAPTAAALSLWAQNAGMWSRAVRIRWRHLLALRRYRAGRAAVQGWQRRPADGRQCRAGTSLPEGSLRGGKRLAGRGRRAAAVAGLGRRGGVVAREPRPVAADAPFNFRWLRRSRVAGAPRAARHRPRLVHGQLPDDLPAAPGHGDGQQGAAVPQRLDPGAALRDDGRSSSPTRRCSAMRAG